MNEFFGQNGLITRIPDNFVYRKEQLEMAEFIFSLFGKKGCAIVEAGTGVGKSLSYLIPAIVYSVENNKKIAVSTETKTLQQQLLKSDIPIAEKLLQPMGISFTCSLCLGSANYLCQKRFNNFIKRGAFAPKDFHFIESINSLLKTSKLFNRYDINIPDRIWNEICRVPEYCTNNKCSYYFSCVFQSEKKRWNESNILIMNHHLFFSNIAADKTYLPDMDVVIFDEAHSLEDICSDLLGFSIEETDFPELLNDYYTLKIHDKKFKKTISTRLLKKIDLMIFYINSSYDDYIIQINFIIVARNRL